MNEARPFASLSSGLLARKGAAKPAMRPQGYTGFEDLDAEPLDAAEVSFELVAQRAFLFVKRLSQCHR